jgi:hypothetical protein
MPDDPAWLQTPAAIRAKAEEILARADDRLAFDVDLDAIPRVAEAVVSTTRDQYPDLAIPIHGRFRHFEVGSVDRIGRLRAAIADPIVRARAFVDLVVVSVLLDAGAGSAWTFVEEGRTYARSEGLGVASFAAFARGAWSSTRADDRYRVDARALAQVDRRVIEGVFQVDEGNPLVGVDGRAALLRRLGDALAARPDLFGEAGRPGGLVDRLRERSRVTAEEVLGLILDGLGPIWPGREIVAGVPLGDVFRHPRFGLVPFHKLSQWLTYSLVEPLAEAGIVVEELDALTGLPEYRNGGLLIDLGAIVPRDEALLSRRHAVSDPAIIEWRALTIALIDRVCVEVRARLGRDLPLPMILEGGTWAAGRAVASARRPGGGPPIEIESDGTVF